MTVLRALSFWVLAPLLAFFAWFLCTVGWFLEPRRGRVGHAALRFWGRAMLAASGARLRVVGAERLRPAQPRVLAANHASYLDIPAILVAFPGPSRFVARHTLAWMPFVGWYIALGGHFFVNRDDPRQALRMMGRVGRRMRRDGLSPIFFPEGTRSPDGRLRDLKPGAFLLPTTLEVPVQPIAILGTHAILPKGAWFPRRCGDVEVRIGEAIPAVERGVGASRKALADRTRSALAALGVPVADAPPS